MQCKKCQGPMEDTHGTSFGTGEPIYRCAYCGWTGLLKDGDVKESTKSEDVFYDGIKYDDYKTVIEVIGADGERKVEFTTWRADILTAMVRAGLVAGAETQIFEPGDTFTVKAAPNV